MLYHLMNLISILIHCMYWKLFSIYEQTLRWTQQSTLWKSNWISSVCATLLHNRPFILKCCRIKWKKSNQEEESVQKIWQLKNLWRNKQQKIHYMKSWWESQEKISNWKKKISIWKKWLKSWNRTIKKKNRKKSHQKWLSHDSKTQNFEIKNNFISKKSEKNDNIIQYYDNYSSNCIFNHIQRYCVDYFAFVSDPFKIILENQADEKKSAFFKMISFWIKKI